MSETTTLSEWEVISVYTRAQAIADGELVDLTEWAGPRGMINGFTIPVAVTRAVWSDLEAIPASLAGLADVRGCGHDLLWMARYAAAAAPERAQVLFRVILPVRGERARTRVYKLHCGPGDAGEPVITIMRLDED